MQASKEQIKRLGRLKKRSDFLRANDRSPQSPVAKWVSKGMIFLTLPGPDPQSGPRVGITVTKKLDKSAVRRNRMKRRLRAAARDVLSHKGLDGTDYVLIARPETALQPYEALKKDMAWCLRRLAQRALEEEAGREASATAFLSVPENAANPPSQDG